MAPASEPHSSNGAEPEVPRKKKWAPRTRSGCQTCRTRRVKCDETRPACKRCLAHGVACPGWPEKNTGARKLPVLAPRQAEEPSALRRLAARPVAGRAEHEHAFDPSGLEFFGAAREDGWYDPTDNSLRQPAYGPVWRNASIAVFAQKGPWTQHSPFAKVPLRLVPSEWQLFEAIAFFSSVVVPTVVTSRLFVGQYAAPRSIEPYDEQNDMIVACALEERIGYISSMHALDLRPSECYNTTHLWIRLFALMARSLEIVNRDIANTGNAGDSKVIGRILDMCTIEYNMKLPGWRVHLEGLLSYLELTRNVRGLMKADVGTANAIRKSFVRSHLINSLTRPEHMMAGISRFSEADIMYVYRVMPAMTFPCPSKVFRYMRRITQLRVAAAGGVDVADEAAGVLQGIAEFDPKSWTESWELPESEHIPRIARLYQLAMELYCILAPHITRPRWRRQHVARRDEAMQILAVLWEDPMLKSHIVWPVVVTGFAVSFGGSERDKATIVGYLEYLRDTYHRTGGKMSLESLERFWVTSKTRWDDCWGAPFIVTG